MALELETIIMNEIGLGNHFNWYNGSGACMSIRIGAADKVYDAIQRHYDAGDSIAPPDKDLVAALKTVAAIGDNSFYSLTKTWQAASDVIATHIHQAGATKKERAKAYASCKRYIEIKYLPEQEETFGVDGAYHRKNF